MLRLILPLSLLLAAPALAGDREVWLRGDGDLVYIQEEGRVFLDRDGKKGFTKVARTKWPVVSQEALRKERLRSWDPPRSSTGVVLYTSYPYHRHRHHYRYGPSPYRSYRYARPYRTYGYGHTRYGGRHYRAYRGTHHGRSHVSHRGSRRGDVGGRGYSREMLGHRGRRYR